MLMLTKEYKRLPKKRRRGGMMKIFKYLGFAATIIFAVGCSVCSPALIWLLTNYNKICGVLFMPIILLLPPIGWFTGYSMWDIFKDK